MSTSRDSGDIRSHQQERLWRQAVVLAWLTITYNLAEGAISLVFGVTDEALSLAGFGADSCIEVVAAIGVLNMVMRLRRDGHSRRDEFERTSLRITGVALCVLALLLPAMVVVRLAGDQQPESMVPGFIISSVSLLCMWLLIRRKTAVGVALESAPILADARCSSVCMQMSAVLLASSGLYLLTGFGWFDLIGSAVLSWYAFAEGRECFHKARSLHCGDTCC